MSITQSIRQRGFRKWYERELLIGHSHLVLLLLSTVGFIGALEAWSQDGAQRLLVLASALVAGAVGVWTLRRYLFLLMRAELIANQAVCPECKTYARWQLDDNHAGGAEPDADDDGDEGGGETMMVCCRKCHHRWPIKW